METAIRQRINDVINNKGLNITSYSNGDKAIQRRLNRQLREGASITYETISSILQSFEDVNPEWLLTGKGEMLKKLPGENTIAAIEKAVSKEVKASKIIENLSTNQIENFTHGIAKRVTDYLPNFSVEEPQRKVAEPIEEYGNSRLLELEKRVSYLEGENNVLREQLRMKKNY